MVSPAVFESAGQRTEHFVPGVYSRSYNVTSPAGISSGNHVILGSSLGGEPMKLLEFGTIAEAKNTLISGELLDAVAASFNCSNDYVPQKVFALRVNNGTQATLTLSSGGTELLKLYSWDWGAHCNKIKVMISAGTLPTSKKLSVSYKDESTVIDNILMKCISVAYVGTGASATLTIENGTMKLSGLDETSAAVDVFEFGFESYSTLDDLAAAVNDTGVYTCNILTSNSNFASSKLDTVSGVSLSDTETPVYANYQAFIDAVLKLPYFGKVEELQSAVRTIPENTTSYVYFTGGSTGTTSISSWNDGLKVLETEDIQIISTPSTDASIQTLIAAHCKEMSSTVNRKERTCILGMGIDASDDDSITRASGFNSKYVSLVADSAKIANSLTGEVQTVSGAIVGCMLAGMESGLSVGEPLTNKTLNVLEFTKKRTITNMEKLIKGGILVCNNSPTDAAQRVVIRAMTTFQGEGDLISCERSMVREDLYMNRDLRSCFAGGIGRPNEVSEDGIIQTLKDAARKWKGANLIIPKGSENVWNIKVTFNGDKVYLYFSRYLTAPRNFVFITATNHVYETQVEL